MSDSRVCPKCGASNPPGHLYCGNCGSSMESAVEPIPSASPATRAPSQSSTLPPTRPSFDYSTEFARLERVKQVDRTKTGLLLLVIGFILGALPYINILGGLISLIGAILVILGRRAFGEAHSKYTIWSLVLFIIGIVGSFIIGAAVAATVISAAFGGPANLADTLANTIGGLLIAGVVVAAIFGIAEVLFTYALQRPTGRYLLWTAYVARLAIGITVVAIIGPQFSQAFRDALAGGTFNASPIQAVEDQQRLLNLLNLIPAGIYATAYYIARERVQRGEIPTPVVPVN